MPWKPRRCETTPYAAPHCMSGTPPSEPGATSPFLRPGLLPRSNFLRSVPPLAFGIRVRGVVRIFRRLLFLFLQTFRLVLRSRLFLHPLPQATAIRHRYPVHTVPDTTAAPRARSKIKGETLLVTSPITNCAREHVGRRRPGCQQALFALTSCILANQRCPGLRCR